MKLSTIVPLFLTFVAAAFAADPPTSPSKKPAAQFDLVHRSEVATIVFAETEHKGVFQAARDLQRDITKVTGLTPNIVHSVDEAAGKCIVIGTAGCPGGKALLKSVGMATDDLDGRWESFKYRVLNNTGGKEQVLAIAGSDFRGTIFGVYDFEQKHMGIDPLWFWADHDPATRSELRYDDRINFGPTNEPTWKYRGWTLNDHPQFIEWKESGLLKREQYRRYMFSIDHEVFDRVWEAALRLKMNMFTWYFVDVDWQPDRERLQRAVDRGLFITQHQMEGVGAYNGYWDDYWKNHNPTGKPDVFSYRKHPGAFREFWGYYVKQLSQFSPQVVWELNLRGWADGPYTEPTLPKGGSDEERARVISDAIADQAKLVREIDPNPDPEMMTTLYGEVGKFYDEGWITVPEGVTTGFGDAGMDGMSYSKRFWTEPRDPKRKYGQYFHTQYFGGGPQIAKCTNIEKYLMVNLGAIHERGDTRHMLLAMNELRHQQVEIRAIAEMLWDFPAFKPRQYLLRYCNENFGDEAGPKVLDLYDQYYAKYPHILKKDEFKEYTYYYMILEPFFHAVTNLNNIKNGKRDGVVANYRYDRKIYEQGIRDLGEVLKQAEELLPSIPENRQYFYTYEFIDSIQFIRGIYSLTIAVNDAITSLKDDDRKGALVALQNARPLVDDLYAAFEHTKSTEKWKYWYRSGTNEDFYLLFNLYQKARLSLEVDELNFVREIEPQRRPYRGNVVMHNFTQAGDIAYGAQAERIHPSMFNGANASIMSQPLKRVFQIQGVQRVDGKWDNFVPDYDLGYQFELQGRATVYVAVDPRSSLEWLATEGFQKTDQTMDVGFWAWPYRYQNRPPAKTVPFELFAREYPAGKVALGKNQPRGNTYPYIVLVQPALLAYENFHADSIGEAPDGWQVESNGGIVQVVENPDYEGEIRPTVFDLRTVPRYTPLELRSLRLETTGDSKGAASARLPFMAPSEGDFVVQFRVKPGQSNGQTSLSLETADGQAGITVWFGEDGLITAGGSKDSQVEVGPCSANRWYNLTVDVSPKKRQFSVSLQDDRIDSKSTGNLELPDSLKGPFSVIQLRHSGDVPGSWIEYDALWGYNR
ncbi:MAG: glycosyl hydrolase 115 family protein [Verrucomicrobiales bacterium]|nr:glycosyl hydrolase 115 family protein [Verrucomicrobiales bacterium]